MAVVAERTRHHGSAGAPAPRERVPMSNAARDGRRLEAVSIEAPPIETRGDPPLRLRRRLY